MALSVNVTRAKSNQFGNKSLISLPSLTPLLTPLTPLTPLITFPIEVPIINIHGQTTIDGKYSYKSHENIVKKCKCKKHFATNLKTTIFHKNNIPLQCVVKGKGSLANKVNIMVNLGETNYDIFLESFLQYAMLKYVLIRLLYGEFDLNKMAHNFNKQFFKDLNNSRFCGFIDYFESQGLMDFYKFYIKIEKSI